jgi:Tfp pilus assembly protein PilO
VDKPDPLAQLKDIHLPDPISWWPLAPGWYVVIALVFLLALYLGYQVYKRHRDALAKKKALALLETYQQHYEKEHNVPATSAHISELLRRVALVYFPREEVASLHGEAWLQFLNQTGKDIDFNSVRNMLLDAPFRNDNTMNLDPLFHKAKLWIRQRSRPCSN